MQLTGSARIGVPIALGLISALMFLSLTGSVAHAAVLGFFAPIPLMVAALGLGVRSVALSGLVAASACGAVGGPAIGVSFAGIAVFPALLVSNRALRFAIAPDNRVLWYPAGWVLAWLAVVTTGLLLLWIAALPDHEGGLRGWLDEFLRQALDMLGDQVDPKERQEITRMLSAILPGMIANVWMSMAAVNAMIAQAILSRLGQGVRPSPDYQGLDLPSWLVLLPLAAGLVWAVTTGENAYIAANVVLVGLMPFAAMGIAAAHSWIGRRPNGAAWGFVAFYGTLMLFLLWALIPLTMAGLVRFIRSRIYRQFADRTEG